MAYKLTLICFHFAWAFNYFNIATVSNLTFKLFEVTMISGEDIGCQFLVLLWLIVRVTLGYILAAWCYFDVKLFQTPSKLEQILTI